MKHRAVTRQVRNWAIPYNNIKLCPLSILKPKYWAARLLENDRNSNSLMKANMLAALGETTLCLLKAHPYYVKRTVESTCVVKLHLLNDLLNPKPNPVF